MVYTLQESEQQLVELTRRLCRTELKSSLHADDPKAVVKHNLATLAQAGLLGVMLPVDCGGAQASARCFVQILEQLAKTCACTAFLYNTHIGAAAAVARFASKSLKTELLPKLASGASRCGLALTEPGGGSDHVYLATTAQKHGDTYLLNGRKSFISGLACVDAYFVLVRTGTLGKPASISAVWVHKDSKGLHEGKPENKHGLSGLPTGDLSFDSCLVHQSHLLGEPGDGLHALREVGSVCVLGAGAMAMGLAQNAVEQTSTHLRSREVAGRKLGSMEGVQLRFSDMLIELNAARSMVFAAANARDAAHSDAVSQMFQAKINATEKALRIIDAALQLHGCNGYSRDLPIEAHLRDARALTLHFGSNDVLRQSVCKMHLGIN